jgi:hypothetical protein
MLGFAGFDGCAVSWATAGMAIARARAKTANIILVMAPLEMYVGFSARWEVLVRRRFQERGSLESEAAGESSTKAAGEVSRASETTAICKAADQVAE